jgi:hypothetical protein
MLRFKKEKKNLQVVSVCARCFISFHVSSRGCGLPPSLLASEVTRPTLGRERKLCFILLYLYALLVHVPHVALCPPVVQSAF